jgi:hypothetical protein
MKTMKAMVSLLFQLSRLSLMLSAFCSRALSLYGNSNFQQPFFQLTALSFKLLNGNSQL